MTAEPSVRRATFADLARVPDHCTGEILNGELVVSPRPAPRHASAASVLMGELSGPFRFGRGGPGGWVPLIEPELHLGDDAVVPDLAGWRRARMPHVPATPAVELAPDWVCEVLSPSTEARDRADKMPIYLRAEVRHAWLVDAELRTLEIFRREPHGWLLVATHVGDKHVRAEPFDAVELDLALLWAD